jgi:hypothetical protein
MNKVFGVVLSMFACLACGNRGASSSDKPDFTVVVRASTDDDRPLEGVAIIAARHRLGATSSTGTLTARTQGEDGQTLPVTISCPDGYVAPATSPPLRLTHARALASGKTEPLVYDVVCDRKMRNVIVAVKAAGSKSTPVLVNGERQAITDDNGIAHVALVVDRSTPSVRVDLDTSSEPNLVPQSPSRTFALNGRDSVLIFDQALSRRSRPKPKGTPAPARHIPQRLN